MNIILLIFSVNWHDKKVVSSVELVHSVKLQRQMSNKDTVSKIPYEKRRKLVLNGLRVSVDNNSL